MEVQVFGKLDCGKCESTRHKVEHFIHKLGVNGTVRLSFFDLDTVDGMAEGAFYDVRNVPTTIIRNDGCDLARWDGVVPDSRELKQYFAGTA